MVQFICWCFLVFKNARYYAAANAEQHSTRINDCNNIKNRVPSLGIQCQACASPIRRLSDITALLCGHVFHSECIERWAKLCAHCPCCTKRHEISCTRKVSIGKLKLFSSFDFGRNCLFIRYGTRRSNNKLVVGHNFVVSAISHLVWRLLFFHCYHFFVVFPSTK